MNVIEKHIYRWLSSKRSYKNSGGFEKIANKVISDTLNEHRILNMCQMKVNLYRKIGYYDFGIFLTL